MSRQQASNARTLLLMEGWSACPTCVQLLDNHQLSGGTHTTRTPSCFLDHVLLPTLDQLPAPSCGLRQDPRSGEPLFFDPCRSRCADVQRWSKMLAVCCRRRIPLRRPDLSLPTPNPVLLANRVHSTRAWLMHAGCRPRSPPAPLCTGERDAFAFARSSHGERPRARSCKDMGVLVTQKKQGFKTLQQFRVLCVSMLYRLPCWSSKARS